MKILKSIKISNFIGMLSVAFLSIITFSIINIVTEYRQFQSESDKIRSAYINTQKQIIKGEIDKAITYINYMKLQTEHRLKKNIQERTYEAIAIASNIYSENVHQKKHFEIQKMIRDALHPVRYNNGRGYYFGPDFTGMCQLFADRPELVGKNLSGMKDTQGKFVIQEIIKIAKNKKEGFLHYQWTKPDKEGKDFPKIAFVKLFEPYHWVIGTGEYLDDVESDIKKEVMQRIAEIRYGETGYLFVIRFDGVVLVNNTQPHLVGKNTWELTDPNGVKIVQEMHKTAENPEGGFNHYIWNNPTTNKHTPKLSFVKGIKDWEWIVGTGVYIDEIEKEIAAKRSLLVNETKQTVLHTLLYLAVLMVFIYFLVIFISKRLNRDLNKFSEFFNTAATKYITFDPKHIDFIEFKTLIMSANQMVEEREYSQTQLQRAYSVMEEKVRDRTAKLSELNSKLKQQIQDRIKSEDKFLKIFQNAPVVIAISTLCDDRYFEVNNAFTKVTGYEKKEAVGKTPTELGIIKQEDQDRFKTALMKKRKIGPIEVELTRQDYSVATVQFIGEFIDVDGKTRLLSIMNDITELKQLESHIQQSQKIEAIGTLAGGIAHDFNNMLGIITGNISYVLSCLNKDDELYEVLMDVQESSKQAQGLTQQLLTFSKGGEPVKKPADINKIIRDAAIFSIRGANSKCNFDLSDDLWASEVDEGQINQVVNNLVINANQAMPNGGMISIRTENFNIETRSGIPLPPGQYVKIVFEDQGVGIPKNHLSSIFEPYFTTKQKGSGLGLATTYSIIKKHDGYITVYSEVEKGTVFNVYLPASLKNPIDHVGQTETKHKGKGRILLMDDQEPILKMAARMLNRMGYKTELAMDGAEAIEKYRQSYQGQNPFSLVILDLTIPGGMGGLKTLIELLKIDSEVKAIVSSGYSNDPVMANYEDYGFYDVVPKPYTKDQLSKVLNKVFGEQD